MLSRALKGPQGLSIKSFREALRGSNGPSLEPSRPLKGDRGLSKALEGPKGPRGRSRAGKGPQALQGPSRALKGLQGSSKALKTLEGPRRPSRALKGPQELRGPSRALKAPQGPSKALKDFRASGFASLDCGWASPGFGAPPGLSLRFWSLVEFLSLTKNRLGLFLFRLGLEAWTAEGLLLVLGLLLVSH